MKNKLLKIGAFITTFSICFTALPMEAIAVESESQTEVVSDTEDISEEEEALEADFLINDSNEEADEVESESEDEAEEGTERTEEDALFSIWESNEDTLPEEEIEEVDYALTGDALPEGPEDGIYFDNLTTFHNRYSDQWDAIRTSLWTSDGHSAVMYVTKDVYDYMLQNYIEYGNQVARGWDWDYVLDFYEEREGAEGWSGDYMFYHTTLSSPVVIYDWEAAHDPSLYERLFYQHNGVEYYKADFNLFTENYEGFDISKEPEVETIVSNLVGPGGDLDVTKYKSDAAKIKAAYNWVVSNVQYNSGYNSTNDSLYYFAYAGFTEGKGSCECMAQCFYYICRKMGVGVRILFNNAGHVYNMARVGNSWYYVDCSAKKCLKGTGSMGTFKTNEMILPSWCYDYRVFKANYLDWVPKADYVDGIMLYSDVKNINVRAGESSAQLHVYSEDSCDAETEVTNATWKSSNPKVATVSGGVVTGVAPGSAVISAVSGKKTITFSVMVYKPVQSVSITPLDKEVQIINGRPAITVLSSEESFRVKAQYDPEGSTLYDICDLSSTNTSVVTVGLDYEVPAGPNYSYQIGTIKGMGDTTLLLKTKAEDGSIIKDELDVYVCPKVTLEANGGLFGSEEKLELAVPYGGRVGAVEAYAEPRRAGFKFQGWFTRADGGTIVDEDQRSILYDTTLYAHWDYAYTASKPVFVNAKGEEIRGEVPYGTKVYLKNSTYGSEIRYTLATGDSVPASPTEESELYKDAFIITEKTTINATSFKENYKPGTLASPVVFTVKDESSDWGDIVTEDQAAYANADSVPKGLWTSEIADVTYTSKAITPEIRVYFGKTLLTQGSDYTIKYNKNKTAGAASVTITGKNNYSGNLVKTFNILPVDLSLAASADDVFATNNGRLQKLQSTVYANIDGQSIALKANSDIIFEYCNTDKKDPLYNPDACTKVGDWEVKVKAKSTNFTGEMSFTEHIVAKTVVSKLKITVKDSFYDEGNEVAPIVQVMDGKKLLVSGTDYVLAYGSNKNIGTYPFQIEGRGEYCGTKTLNYKIVGTDISKFTLEYDPLADPVYNGSPKSITGIKIYQKGNPKKGIPDGAPLVLNTDYSVRYENNVNVAGKNKSFAYIEGKNGYVGTKKIAFTINSKPLSSGDITASASTTEYSKGGAIPNVEVRDGAKILDLNKDYTIRVANNKAVSDGASSKVPTVTITGKGNYSGTISKTFSIVQKDISDVDISISDIVYQNKAGICKPKITIKDTDGKALAARTDYDANIIYTYENDTRVKRVSGKTTISIEKAGATLEGPGDVVDPKDIIPKDTVIRATIAGNKNYKGTTSVLFRYVEASVSSARVTVKSQSYTGKEIYPSKSDITVTIGNKPLDPSEYRVIGYSNNINKGNKATLTIEGLGSYGGTKTVNFTIASKTMTTSP